MSKLMSVVHFETDDFYRYDSSEDFNQYLPESVRQNNDYNDVGREID